MTEMVTQARIWRDRILGRDELYNRRAADQVLNKFFQLPIPVKTILIGFSMRFNPREDRQAYVDTFVEIARNDGEDHPWIRRSFALFLDGPTRRIANHRMDHAVMEYMGYTKGGIN